MRLYNHRDAARQIGVGADTVERWVREGRMHFYSKLKNKPIFVQENIDEIIEERKKYDRPAVKDNMDDPIPA